METKMTIKVAFEVRYDDTDAVESAFTKEFEDVDAVNEYRREQSGHPFLYLAEISREIK
jgi:hypothetical protein